MRSSQSMLYNQLERQAFYVAVDEWYTLKQHIANQVNFEEKDQTEYIS